MKRYISVLVAIGFVLALSSFALAGTDPATGIVGSAHDLSSFGPSAGFGDSVDQAGLNRICIYCHAPHNTVKSAGNLNPSGFNASTVTYYPLWNHDITTLTYQTYTNGPDAPTVGQHAFNGAPLSQPGSVSRLCLSCHDGSVAPNVYGNFNGATSSNSIPGTMISGGKMIGGGGDLTNHHPIGMNYANVVAADDEIATPDTQFIGFNPTGLTIGDVLWGGKMECSTCHDVHNTKSQGTKFTWVSDEQSNLCLSCHLK